METMQFPTLEASGAVHSILLDLGFFLKFDTVDFPDCPVCVALDVSDLSEMQNLPNICWIPWETLLDTNVVCRLSEIAYSIYCNKIFLCSTHTFSQPNIFVLNIPFP